MPHLSHFSGDPDPFLRLTASPWLLRPFVDTKPPSAHFRTTMEKDNIDQIIDSPLEKPSAVQLAVGGMTCVACVRAITEAVSEIEGVSEISVNQLGKSASVVVTRNALVDSVVTLIEDIGYECQVISVTPYRGRGRLGRRGQNTNDSSGI